MLARQAARLARPYPFTKPLQLAPLRSFHRYYRRRDTTGAFLPLTVSVAAVCGLGIAIVPLNKQASYADVAEKEESGKGAEALPFDERLAAVGARVEGLREYSREEVAQHKTKETGIWVTFLDGVFDITSFVTNHPGGMKRIMLAAGGDVGGFWEIYQQHLSKDVAGFIAESMQEMRIGNVKPGEDAPMAVDDPYKDEPKRSPALLVHTRRSFNAEPPKHLLGSDWITPTELFYVRHHHPVPVLDKPEDYRLEVTGKGCNVALSLSLEDLRKLFVKNTVVVTTQCAGNRREGLNQLEATQGLNWGSGAISTAEWGGVWLRDVLKLAGVEDMDDATAAGALHVQFSGIDEPYDASIPIDKALAKNGDVMLAYEMNGKNLPREHGFPLRVIVPGHLGARSVKWLKRINVSHEEAYSPWQRGVAYRGFGPHVRRFDDASLNPDEAPPVQELPVQSAITNWDTGDQLEVDASNAEAIEIKGYAWAGGGRRVIRVDVSVDGGKTWSPAELKQGRNQPPGRAWAWVLWEAELPVPADALEQVRQGKDSTIELCCKAVDESFNTQPESPAPIWNLRGILNNSWDRIVLTLVPEEEDDG